MTEGAITMTTVRRATAHAAQHLLSGRRPGSGRRARYLRDEGLEIEFTEGDTAANTIPRMANGALMWAMATSMR
jgi:hypothetical protein